MGARIPERRCGICREKVQEMKLYRIEMSATGHVYPAQQKEDRPPRGRNASFYVPDRLLLNGPLICRAEYVGLYGWGP